MTSTLFERRNALEAQFRTWPSWTLHELLDHRTRLHPDRELVIDEDDAMTYSQVQARSRLLADGMVRLGLQAGDRVGVLLPNDGHHVAVRVALSRVGATAVSLNYLYRADELAFVLRDSACRMLVTASSFKDLDHLSMLDEIDPEWVDGAADALPDLRRVIQHGVDGPEREGLMNLRDVAALGEDVHNPQPTSSRRVGAQNVSDILYTSGIRPARLELRRE